MTNNAQYLYKNTTSIQSFKFLNLQEIVSNLSAKLLWGNGYILSSTEPDIKDAIEKLEKANNLTAFFYEQEKVLSVFGSSITTIDKTEGDYIVLTIAQPNSVSRVARINETELQATVLMRYKYDDIDYFIRTIYTDKEIKRELTDTNETAVVGASYEKVNKDLQLKTYEAHDYGTVPIIYLQNLPFKNFYGGSNVGSAYPDNTAVKNLQIALDKHFETLLHELQFNRTRVFGRFTQLELNQLQTSTAFGVSYKNRELIQQLLSDFIVQTDAGIPGDQRSVDILMSDPKLQVIFDAIDSLINIYKEGCGYSREGDGQKDQTAFEMAVKKSNDLATTRIKRTLRTRQYKRMLKKIFIMMGVDRSLVEQKDSFVFEIKENIIMDEIKKIEISNSLIETGLSSRVREIAKFNGVSLEEAEKLKEKIDAENQRDQANGNLYLDGQLEQAQQVLNNKGDNNGINAKNTETPSKKPV